MARLALTGELPNRRKDGKRYKSAVRAASPAAGPSHPALKLGESFLNPNAPRLRFLAGGNPTDPLIARKWRYIVPYRFRLGDRSEGFSQIRGHVVHHSIFQHCFYCSAPSKLEKCLLNLFVCFFNRQAFGVDNNCLRPLFS